MEQPQPPHGEKPGGVNSYGTDDPAKQAEIEAARSAAAQQRRHDRAELERLVVAGMNPDDAEALIEFNHYARDQRAHAASLEVPPDTEAPEDTETEVGRHWPRIYVADEASLARGIRHGLWVDANQDPDDLDADIAMMLDSSPTVDAKAWSVRKAAGFAGIDVIGQTDTERISRIARGVAEHGEAFAAYLDWVGQNDEDALEQFGHHYMGTYRSLAEWGKQSAADLEWPQQIEQKLDGDLARYVRIDHEAFAKDAASWWHIVHGDDGIHVFAP